MIRNKKLVLKESWVWEDPVTELIKPYIFGKSLNVCSGESKLCSVKVDIDPKRTDIIKADMNELPFKDNSFDVVLSDPPWKLNYYHRMKPFFECVRVCKVNGVIIYNATWLPESKIVELEKIFVRQSARFGNISIIAIFRKTKELSELDRLHKL